MTEQREYDPAIYSPTSTLVNHADGTSEWRRLTWAQLWQDQQEEIARLRKFERMVCDLDRNQNGRHEGDIDTGGTSQGNPRLHTGDVLGYGLGGSVRYVMPERGRRHDPDAWIVR